MPSACLPSRRYPNPITPFHICQKRTCIRNKTKKKGIVIRPSAMLKRENNREVEKTIVEKLNEK